MATPLTSQIAPAHPNGDHPVAVAQRSPYRVTVEQFHRMTDAGVFGPDKRFELLDGVIYQLPVPSPAHNEAVAAVAAIFGDLRGNPPRWYVWPQNSVTLPGENEPSPDVALVRPLPRAEYRRRNPGPEDIFLLIEVAFSSLDSDRDDKAPRYARAGIREYWILDVVGSSVEVYRQPDPAAGRYLAPLTRAQAGDTLSLTVFPEVSVAVADLLGAVS